MTENAPKQSEACSASILSLSGTIQNDQKVSVEIDLREGHASLDLELKLTDATGQLVSRSTIMDSMDRHIRFTLHIRTQNPRHPLTLTCSTIQEETICETKSIILSVP